ncbi:hypothetical protein LAZ67_1001224, partial [Cordylochernes scorpioides]
MPKKTCQYSSHTYHTKSIHAPIRHHTTNTHNPHNKRNTRAKRQQQPVSACTIVKNNTIIPSTQNIEKIHATKQPHNRKTLRSFLKAVNAYKEFIPDHARLRTPLVNLLKKDVMWVWDDECQKAFTNLKENLTTHPTLHLYQEGLPCQVYCNTSTFSITSVLKQVYPDGKTYTVQHFSRSLRSHERNYSDLELQCLAIVESVDNFRTCLMGRKFTIFSDHPALQWLKEIKAPSGRLFRWRLRLSRYEYEVRSINGVQQYETGVGTRIPFCGFLDAPLIQSQQSSPPGKSRVTMDHTKLRTVSRKGVLKTIVPSSLTTRLLKSVHTQHHHPNISKMTRLISSQYYWQNMTQDIAKQVKTCPTCRFARRIDEYNQPSRKNTDTGTKAKQNSYIKHSVHTTQTMPKLPHPRQRNDHTSQPKPITADISLIKPLTIKQENCKPDNQFNHITPLPKDIKQENCEPTNHLNSTINKKDPTDDISKHISKLESLWNDMQNELTKQENLKLPESMLMCRIINTLPDEYFDFKSVWESVSKEERSVDNLTQRLRLLEIRIQQRDECSTSSSTALMANAYENKQNMKGKVTKSNENFQKTRETRECYFCHRKGHLAKDCSERFNEQDEDIWIGDSGATNHITRNASFYTYYKDFPNQQTVKVGSNEKLIAYGSGTITIETCVKGKWQTHYLTDVWYVPNFSRNVMSLQSTLDKGFEMKMDKKNCKLFKTTPGEVIVEGKRLPGGLYGMLITSIKPENAAEVNLAKTQNVNMLQLWHERFGHQNKRHVQKWLKEQGIDAVMDNEPCEACIYGKQHRLSFGSREQYASTQPGNLIHVDTTGHIVKEILTDGGKEFVNKETSKITNKYGINNRITMQYTPQQNGSAERENRTLIEAARSMIYAKNMSLKLWAGAVNTATYVLNRTGPTQIEGKTPYELWFDKKPAVDHLRIFGTECFVHVPDEKRRKLDAKSEKGILVGYCSNKDGYRIWMPNSNKVVTSRDVIFKETIPTFSLDIEKRNKELSSNQIDEQNDTQDIEKIESNVQTSDVYNLRDRSNISKPQRYIDAEINIAEGLEPKTYKEAMDSPNAQFWKEAMNEEINSLTENDVYECTTLPPGQKPIDCKWVLKTKLNSKGEITRYKARLVAKGFAQKKGIDYEETFSPVTRHDTIRTLLAIAANEDLKLITSEPLNYFLGIEIERQPDGSIFINQKAYIKRILEKFNMSQANKVGTPTDNSTVPGEAEILENVPFREAIGSLMHLSCLTRPDITFALNKVSQNLAAPTIYDWEAVKRIFRYLLEVFVFTLLDGRLGKNWFPNRLWAQQHASTAPKKVISLAKEGKEEKAEVKAKKVEKKKLKLRLGSLPDKYMNFITAWDSVSSEEKTLENLTARLLKEESLQDHWDSSGNSKPDNALMTFSKFNRNSTASNKQQQHQQSIKDKKKNTHCGYCKKKGHWWKECYKRKEEQKGQQPSSSSRDDSCAFSAETSAFLAETKDSWIADSGATDHMTFRREWFSTFEEIPEGVHPVCLGDGKQIYAKGKGNIDILSYVDSQKINATLLDVLYVPELETNLFSISTATKHGLTLICKGNQIKLTKNSKVLVTGIKDNSNLYRIFIKAKQSSQTHVAQLSLDIWHQRMGHVNPIKLTQMFENNVFEDDIKIREKPDSLLCEACIYGKQNGKVFHASTSPNSTYPGELIYSDVCGPMSKRSPGGSLYFVSFKDDFSRFRVAYFIRHKSDVLEKFNEFVKRVRTETGNKIKRFRTDNGTEFLNKNFSDYLKSLGIVHELTAPYTPEQNGIAERDNRTIVESARCLLHGRKMPLELWAEAVNTAVYLLNRCTTKVLGNSTPYEIWYKRKPSILHLKTFGCNAYVHIPKDNRKKLDKKSIRTFFVGYTETNKNYRMWDPIARKIIISRDVIFTEANTSENIQDNQQEQVTIYSEESVDNTNTSSKPEESCRYPLRNRIRENEQTSTSCTRAISYACYVHDQEPLNYEDAIVGQNSKQWKLAMDDEFNSLMKNQTWTYVTLPSDRKAIACKWVYKIKQNADGSNKMFKARLVAKGYSQKPGLDYGETFSPVVKFDSIRTILSLCASLDMEMIQLDVKSAFLNGDLEEELYMEQPQGYENPDFPNHVCSLQKSIYGLKQSPRMWNKKFHEFLIKFDLKPSISDSCVYTMKCKQAYILLAIYVDDCLICSLQSVPSDPYSKLTKEMCPKDNQEIEEMNKIPYRQTIGSLMYLMTGTRPDIAYAVSRVSQFMNNPGPSHWTAVKKIFGYLKATKNIGICFGGSSCTSTLIGFSDADFAGDLDTRKSTTGYVFMLNNGPISWCSQKHAIDLLYVCSNDQAADIFTKALPPERYRRLRSQLGLFETTECSSEKGSDLPGPSEAIKGGPKPQLVSSLFQSFSPPVRAGRSYR